MSKQLVTRPRKSVAKHDSADEPVIVPPASRPGVSFRYSYTEISAVGNAASVRRRETRFENGTLKSESFEGTFDRGAFDEIVRQTQGYLLAQTSLLMKSLFWFLPSSDERQRKD